MLAIDVDWAIIEDWLVEDATDSNVEAITVDSAAEEIPVVSMLGEITVVALVVVVTVL